MKYGLILLGCLAMMTISNESFAQQTRAGRGAVGGAIVGGAIGGGRGAAIGAATGAAVGATQPHPNRRHWHNYYWRNGHCWHRGRDGRSHRVAPRYCR
ncbi:MAG: hypothetical protein M9932_13720 [Xanthobacteraceae bacterium]|nr:hypothetical protein [Xanthobacteraceae bacterium]